LCSQADTVLFHTFEKPCWQRVSEDGTGFD
jgi:hypothetical protein